MASGVHQRGAWCDTHVSLCARARAHVLLPAEAAPFISQQQRCLPDTSTLEIIDLASQRLNAGLLAHVAVINYASADYDLRTAWSIRHDNLPQLRLFSVTGELPQIIPGLQKDGAAGDLAGLTPAQQSMRAMAISGECMKYLKHHPDGKGKKARIKSNQREYYRKQAWRKSEL